MMEMKHRCKLCFRNFANGRALGGHMRSHMVKLYAEEKASKGEHGEYVHHHFQSLHSYSSSSEEEYDEEEREAARGALIYELRENTGKNTVLVAHDFSSVVDGDSEAKSSEKKKKWVCRRSKRVRKSRISDFDMLLVKKTKFEDDGGKSNFNEQSSPLSSISDTTPEEHVALCLIMLSRGTWEKGGTEYLQQQEDEDDDDTCQDSGVAKMMKNKFRGKYRCEECNKLFRSYQALGGHRASHKKIKAPAPDKNVSSQPVAAAVEAKIHQCPFCDRIFSSGQALGGHKRSHFIGASAVSTNCSQNSRTVQVLNIDLNLPAPADDDESSQIAISTVSDDY